MDNSFPPSGSWEKDRAEFSTTLAFVSLTLQKIQHWGDGAFLMLKLDFANTKTFQKVSPAQIQARLTANTQTSLKEVFDTNFT